MNEKLVQQAVNFLRKEVMVAEGQKSGHTKIEPDTTLKAFAVKQVGKEKECLCDL